MRSWTHVKTPYAKPNIIWELPRLKKLHTPSPAAPLALTEFTELRLPRKPILWSIWVRTKGRDSCRTTIYPANNTNRFNYSMSNSLFEVGGPWKIVMTCWKKKLTIGSSRRNRNWNLTNTETDPLPWRTDSIMIQCACRPWFCTDRPLVAWQWSKLIEQCHWYLNGLRQWL